MTTALGKNVEFELYWQGKYDWYDWEIRGVTLSTNNSASSEIRARINTQLPSNDSQQLVFFISPQTLAANHTFLPLSSNSENNKKATTTIKCSVAAAQALSLKVNILYSEKVKQSAKDKPYTRSDVVPPIMSLPNFQEGEKYTIFLSHQNNRIHVDFEKKQQPADFIFNVLAESLHLMRYQSLSPYHVVLEIEAQIEKLASQIIKNSSHKEVKALIKKFEAEQLVIPHNRELHTEEEYEAILLVTQKTLLTLQTRFSRSKNENYAAVINEDTKRVDVENMNSTQTNPALDGPFIFNAFADSFQTMAQRSLSPYDVVLELEAQMTEFASEISQDYTFEEIQKFITKYETKPLFIPRNSKLHTEEEFEAILYATQQTFLNLRNILPLLSCIETIKKFYLEKNWEGLFHFLRGKLPIQGVALERSHRASLYLSVCHSAKQDCNPQLLAYALAEMPDGPEKENHREIYQNWLSQFDIESPPSE